MDKTVVVTGASSGLGDYITRRLVGEGANVVATARRIERLEALATDLGDAPGQIRVLQADVTSEADATRTMDLAVAEFGRLDALVNKEAGKVFQPGFVGNRQQGTTDRHTVRGGCLRHGF